VEDCAHALKIMSSSDSLSASAIEDCRAALNRIQGEATEAGAKLQETKTEGGAGSKKAKAAAAKAPTASVEVSHSIIDPFARARGAVSVVAREEAKRTRIVIEEWEEETIVVPPAPPIPAPAARAPSPSAAPRPPPDEVPSLPDADEGAARKKAYAAAAVQSRAFVAKEEGNSLYTDRQFEDAEAVYSEGVAALEGAMIDQQLPAELDRQLLKTLYSNRAATRLELKRYAPAIDDATAAIAACGIIRPGPWNDGAEESMLAITDVPTGVEIKGDKILVKVLLRRAKALDATNAASAALADAVAAHHVDPSSTDARRMKEELLRKADGPLVSAMNRHELGRHMDSL
jgi:hypothetical protein